ncbi:MAG: APC family permease [Gemmatimonadaceae bacterium]|nr:APC family permease [Gemmatimonadaceae bacterium]
MTSELPSPERPDGSTRETRGARPLPTWQFPGWGQVERLDLVGLSTDSGTPIVHLDQPKRHLLGQWSATAICGNDITSSVLYVSALCAAQAGALAPIVLMLVAGVLYLFRGIYAEVGSALPLNGGTYTVLLNTTSKRLAASAACLTLLSYIATAVISASEAMHYAHNLTAALPVGPATIAVLALFAALTILGVGESANVALGIFILHMVTLVVLVSGGIWRVAGDPSLLLANFTLPSSRGLMTSLFFGFAAAMLGVSGFESSANFIEEQRVGVFAKTLRNMWLAVAVFNPLVSLLSLGLLPLAQIRQVPPDMLARMGDRAVAPWLGTLVSIDAVLVLCGAVLTSYVGVMGLVRRMALDRCLPQLLLRENRRGTNHWIALAFFALCVSILSATGGDLSTLAGVYALSFLSVMALFAIGNLLLKHKRNRLPRAVTASPVAIAIALAAVLAALVGNVLLSMRNAEVFLVYASIAVLAVAAMLFRIPMLSLVLNTSRTLAERALGINRWIRERVTRWIEQINSVTVVYFTKGDSAVILRRAAEYVLRNEQTNRMKVIHVYAEEKDIPSGLADALALIDREFPRLRIDVLFVRGQFTPTLVDQLSDHLAIPKNLMFVGTPGDRFPYRIESLGGVRLIL